MTDYVTRDDTNLGVGRILTSPTMYALYENLIAIAEGAAGAPRIQTAAIEDLAVTDAKLNATVTTAGTDWVLARNAGAAAGAVGTYAYAASSTNVTVGTTWNEPGTTRAGSSLRYSGYYGGSGATSNVIISASALSGTWRCMGFAKNDDLSSALPVHTLWLRIS